MADRPPHPKAPRVITRDGVLRGIRDPKARDSVIVDFAPVKGSRIGELTARFDVVLGLTPEG